MLSRFIRRIRNLIRWLPVIWKDRDYDHFYLEHMMYHKLVHMYNFFISEDAVTNWDEKGAAKSLKALRICITILDRRLNNFYVYVCPDVYDMRSVIRSHNIEMRDERLLGKLIGTYLSSWWD